MTAKPHLIVGAGLAGITTARAYVTEDLPVVIYERYFNVGGIWNSENQCSLVNSESRPQVDPVVFRFASDFSELKDREGVFGGISSTPKEIVDKAKDVVKQNKIKVVFGRSVLSWKANEDGTVQVVSEDTQTSEEKTETFAGIHFRTGSQNSVRECKFQNENLFKGVIGRGINDDVPLNSFKEKNVIIVGSGSTSTDSATRALLSGAKSITILCRRKKLYYSSYASYLLFGLLSEKTLTDKSFAPGVYDKFFDALRKVYKSLNCTQYDLDNQATAGNVVNYLGKLHLRNAHGFDSYHGDSVLLGIKYGIIKVVEDEITEVSENSVKCKSANAFPCDILIKCIGYNTDRKILANNVYLNGFFADKKANITNTIGFDSVNGVNVVGPNNPATLFPNVFAYEELDRISIFFQKNPEKWANFHNSPVFAKLCDPDFYDSFDFLQLLPKFLNSGIDEVTKILSDALRIRSEMREKVLPPKVFLEKYKKEWQLISKQLSERTGQPEVPFPYEDELKQASS